MSSHHIVRENQEPALLVGYFKALDDDKLGQLLEWSPTLITDDHNLDYFLAAGIKVDILFSKESMSDVQEGIKCRLIENNFVTEGLTYLIENDHKAVNLLLNRLDSSIMTFADRINMVVFCDGKRYVIVQNVYEKWKPKGEMLYVDEKYLKSFQGIELIEGGVFRTKEDGFINLEFNSADFVMIGEDI